MSAQGRAPWRLLGLRLYTESMKPPVLLAGTRQRWEVTTYWSGKSRQNQRVRFSVPIFLPVFWGARVEGNLGLLDEHVRCLPQIGRDHVCTPVTNAHLLLRLLLENTKTQPHNRS